MAEYRQYFILDESRNAVCVDDWPMTEWAVWYERADRVVAKTEVGGLLVSTVFLGLNHQFKDGPPLLFETLTFGNGGEICERCSTWAEAETQHERACLMVRDQIEAAQKGGA